VLIAEIGAGNEYASLETERAISFMEPTLVAFVGVAGGLKNLELGDVVIADWVYGYGPGKDLEEFRPRTKSASSSYSLVQRARTLAHQDQWRQRILLPDPSCVPKAVVGTIAAGQKVVASRRSATYQFLAANCSDALAVEMEGWGFLLGTYANEDVKAIVVRAISDNIDDKTPDADRRWQPIAARHAAGFAFELLATWRPPDGAVLRQGIVSMQVPGQPGLPSHPHPDFSIFYVSADLAWAEWIASQLEESGYSVVVQARDSRLGSDSGGTLDKATPAAMHALSVTSAVALAAEGPTWGFDESRSADPDAERVALTPIVVAAIDNEELAGSASIDLVGLDEEHARLALLEGVRRLRARFPLSSRFAPRSLSGGPARPRFPQALPPIWNVPRPRNPDFRGREDLLDDLWGNLLLGETTVLTQAIVGQGGIGKTALATEFAYRHRSDYDLVWWVRAEEATTLVTDYAALAVPLGLDIVGWPDQASVVAAVRASLEARSRWLLVFDNVSARENVVDFIPASASGHVLITSRNQTWPAVETKLAVDVLPLDDASAFLLARTGETDRGAAERLATALGLLPLALEQVAAYIAQNPDLNMTAYLRRLGPEAREPAAGRQLAEPPQTVVSALSFSIESVKNPAATQLLNFVAYLAPDDIPVGLLADVLALLPEPLASAGRSQAGFDDIVETLGRYSLITSLGDAFAVHRMIQEVVRKGLDPVTQKTWTSIAVLALYLVFPVDASETASWAVCARLLPHAITAATHAQSSNTDSRETSLLLKRTSDYLRSRGEFAGALDLSKRAVALAEEAFGPHDRELAIVLNDRGLVLSEAGQWAEAKGYLERALEIHGSSDQDPYGIGTAHHNLSSLLRKMGDYPGAKNHAAAALSTFQDEHGPDHGTVGIALTGLARVSRDLNEFADARAFARRALAINEAAYGPDHPRVGSNLLTLALIERDLGEPAEARKLAERALDIAEAAFGPNHPQVGLDLNGLALIMRDLGDPVVARRLAERALAIHEVAYSPNHPEVGDDLLTVGLLLADLGDKPGARRSVERALTIYESTYGANHTQVAGARTILEGVLAS
jgi:tetratricopeptide (TPR) repeat protein/nucleoside phosphorylase